MYDKTITEASKSALLELNLALKRYKDDMVLSGGWAPYFITKDYFAHCGSIDIDLVLKTEIMPKYDTIRKTILGLGYYPESEFRFLRTVRSPVDNKDYEIHLDFLCEKEGAKYVNLRKVQHDLHAFVFDGLSLAFDFNFEQEIETVLPGNGKARATCKVVDLVGSLALKGQALDGRTSPKDSYDVFALTHFKGGVEAAAEYFNKTVAAKEFSPQNRKLLAHSLEIVQDKFRDDGEMGPYQIESFTDGQITRARAAERVNRFLKLLKFD